MRVYTLQNVKVAKYLKLKFKMTKRHYIIIIHITFKNYRRKKYLTKLKICKNIIMSDGVFVKQKTLMWIQPKRIRNV